MSFPLPVVLQAAVPDRAEPLESIASDRESHLAGLAYLQSSEDSEMIDPRREGPGKS